MFPEPTESPLLAPVEMVAQSLPSAVTIRCGSVLAGGGITDIGQRRPGGSCAGSNCQGRIGSTLQPAGRPSARRVSVNIGLITLVVMVTKMAIGRLRMYL